jgi:ABC-type polysaccharide/polyol phosphate export permease
MSAIWKEHSAGAAPEPFVFSARSHAGVAGMIADIAGGLRAARVWRAFAWEETKRRYRRSALGLLWIVIGYVAFVGAIVLFFNNFNLSSSDQIRSAEHFASYVGLGYAAFSLISSNIQDGAVAFTGSAAWIKSVSLPYSVYAFKNVTRTLTPFALQVASWLVFALAMGHEFKPVALISLAAVAIIAVNGVAMQIFFGFVGARFRDLEHMLSTILRVLLFMTPILYVYDATTGFARTLATANPVTHFVEIFRAPLMGAAPTALSWTMVAASTVVLWGAAILAGALLRRRLPYLV